jgi:hypothetical protein
VRILGEKEEEEEENGGAAKYGKRIRVSSITHPQQARNHIHT